MAGGDDDCYYPIRIDPSSLAEVKRLLDVDHLSRVGCRVVKHADCCVLCAMNNDCTRLPMHWNCFIGSTRVTAPVVPADVEVRVASADALGGVRGGVSGGFPAATAVTETEGDFGRRNIRKVMAREYVGDVITIRTASGQELTGTPNHPIATRAGWVPLAELEVGDHVFRSTRAEWVLDGVDPDVDDVPPTIEQVAETFSVRLDPVETAAEDFHGDGAGSEVHVVSADGLFVDDLVALCAEHFAQVQLGGRPLAVALEFAGARPSREFGVGALHSAYSVVGGGGPLGPVFGAGVGHAGVHGFAAATEGHASIGEPAHDDWSADAEGFCERLDALASDIAADEIVTVDRWVYRGHVYNLETQAGWYLSNSIVTHNCRCKAEGYLESA